MKKGPYSLNPHAAPYVPLSRRATADANNDSSLTGNRGSNESAWLGPHFVNTTQNQNPNQNESRDSESYIAHGNPAPGNYTPRVRGSCGSSSVNSQEMIPIDEMDLAYLQMQFPNVRYEALSDMYWANEGNLAVMISMLNHYRMQFPNARYEALSDMYWANEGNLAVTVSMLNHYRICPPPGLQRFWRLMMCLNPDLLTIVHL